MATFVFLNSENRTGRVITNFELTLDTVAAPCLLVESGKIIERDGTEKVAKPMPLEDFIATWQFCLENAITIEQVIATGVKEQTPEDVLAVALFELTIQAIINASSIPPLDRPVLGISDNEWKTLREIGNTLGRQKPRA